MNKFLRHAAIAGVAILVFTVIGFILGALSAFPGAGAAVNAAYLATMFIAEVSSAIFAWGFKLIGEKARNRLLKTTSLIIVILSVIAAVETVLFITTNYPGAETVSFALSVVAGIASIPFAIGLIGLKKKFGELAVIAGIFDITSSLTIVVGTLLVVLGHFILGGLFVILGVLAFMPAIVMEIILMLRASKRF